MENIENLESVAKTNFKNLFDDKYSRFSRKEFLQIFYKSLQFV